VVCVNGGSGRDAPGTWSASVEYVVRRVAPALPALGFAEVRYRVKSWNRLDQCIEDALEAVEAAARRGARRVLLLGYSMGGAVAIRAASEPVVEGVLGLAPWIPDRLSLEPLSGKRLDVLHGALDRHLPGIPGVSPSLSRRGFERARALGSEGSYTLIAGAVHPIALRGAWGGLVPAPRAAAWARLVSAALEDFAAGSAREYRSRR
jgi:dienelactone hydrolase